MGMTIDEMIQEKIDTEWEQELLEREDGNDN